MNRPAKIMRYNSISVTGHMATALPQKFTFVFNPITLLHSERPKLHTLSNPIALGKSKIVCNFGLSECSGAKCDGDILPKVTRLYHIVETEQIKVR